MQHLVDTWRIRTFNIFLFKVSKQVELPNSIVFDSLKEQFRISGLDRHLSRLSFNICVFHMVTKKTNLKQQHCPLFSSQVIKTSHYRGDHKSPTNQCLHNTATTIIIIIIIITTIVITINLYSTYSNRFYALNTKI